MKKLPALRLNLMLLMIVMCGSTGRAQDAPPAAITPTQLAVENVPVPDIAGTWNVNRNVPGIGKSRVEGMRIQRVGDGSDFELDENPNDPGNVVLPVHWAPKERRFEASKKVNTPEGPVNVFYEMKVTFDGRKMSIRTFERPDGQIESEESPPRNETMTEYVREAVASRGVQHPTTGSGLANTPSEITGKWRGDNWGDIELQLRPVVSSPNSRNYAGSYTDTFGSQPGQIELRWSPSSHRYEGTWTDGEDRAGKLAIRLLPDGKTIRGSWTTDNATKIQPGKPEHSDLEWVRLELQGDLTDVITFTNSDFVARPKPEPREIKILSLLNGSATEYAALLKQLFRSVDISADPRSNSVIVATSNRDHLGEIEAILMRLDESPKRPKEPSGSTGTPSLHSGDITLDTKYVAARSNPEQLSTAIAEIEAKAKLLAEQIRRKSRTLGDNHPEQLQIRQELEKLLQKALQLKLQREQSQVQQLEERVSRLRTQLQFRQSASGKIVERRMRELLEGDTLEWSPDKSVPAPQKGAEFIDTLHPVQTQKSVSPESDWIWTHLGLRMVTTSDPQLVLKPHRGGLLITDVNSAETNQIRTGDVLVGIHDWETLSPQNVLFVVQQSAARPERSNTGNPVPVYLIRNGEIVVVQIFGGGKKPPASIEAAPATTITLVQWLDILQNGRNVENMMSQFQTIASLGKGPDAERVATAMLAKTEFLDPTTPTEGSVCIELRKAVKGMDSASITGSLVRALRDGHPRVKWTALDSISELTNYTASPDFPALAELLIGLAAGNDGGLRSVSLTLLAPTLPITRLDPDEFSTEDRRRMAKRLKDSVPHDVVLGLLQSALDGPQIDVVLTASQERDKWTERAIESDLTQKQVRVLTGIIQGKLGDQVATSGQRGRALGNLSHHGAQAASAVPVLIELLKSDELEPESVPDGRANPFQFTRIRVIATLERIGPAAHEALPELEALLTTFEKKEQEDTLLSPNKRVEAGFSNTTSRRLRQAISRIKGTPSSSPLGFGIRGR